MANENTDTRNSTPVFDWMSFDAANLVAPHLTHLLAAQRAILSDTAVYAERWIERQNTTSQTTFEAIRQLSGTRGDMTAALSILEKWQAQSVDRTAEDVQEWVAFWKVFANRFVTEEIEAEAEAAGVGKRTKGKDKLPTRIPV